MASASPISRRSNRIGCKHWNQSHRLQAVVSWCRSLGLQSDLALEGRPLGTSSAVHDLPDVQSAPIQGRNYSATASRDEDTTRVTWVQLQCSTLCRLLQLRWQSLCRGVSATQSSSARHRSRAADLAGANHEQKFVNASAARGALNCPCGPARLQGRCHARPGSARWVSSPAFPRLALWIFAGPGTRPPRPSWFRHGAPIGVRKSSRPPVSSHPAANSQCTQRLSTLLSEEGQIVLRRRKNPRSLTSSRTPRQVWATASLSSSWMYSRATWAWYTLCCQSLLSSPS